jgi:hypothetical protein
MSDIRDTRQGGWGWYQYELLDTYGPHIGAPAIAVYVALTRFANNATQTTRPAAERIGEVTGLSTRQVRRELAVLAREGLIRSAPPLRRRRAPAHQRIPPRGPARFGRPG